MKLAFGALTPSLISDWGQLQKELGFFRFAEDVDCYGQSCVRRPATNYRAQLGVAWRIEGEGKDRARIAYAHLADGQLKYSFESSLMLGPQAVQTNARDGHSKGTAGLQRSPDSVTTS